MNGLISYFAGRDLFCPKFLGGGGTPPGPRKPMDPPPVQLPCGTRIKQVSCLNSYVVTNTTTDVKTNIAVMEV